MDLNTVDYLVWVKGCEQTRKLVRVPRYPDGDLPGSMKIKDRACKSQAFHWRDYTELRYKRARDCIGSRKILDTPTECEGCWSVLECKVEAINENYPRRRINYPAPYTHARVQTSKSKED